MPEHLHYDDKALFNLETHHEESDVNVRALLIFMAICVVFAVLTHALLYFMFKVFARIENGRAEAPLTQMVRPADMDVPPTPRLQPFPAKDAREVVMAPNENTPVTDMAAMRAEQEKALNSYGVVDRQNGTMHIPIDEAKKLLMQRGLPMAASSAIPIPSSGPTAVPSSIAPATAVSPSSTTTTGDGSAHP